MSHLVTNYLETKQELEKQQKLVVKAIKRIYNAYVSEKNKVSTKNWSVYYIDRYAFKGDKFRLTLLFSYSGGGYNEAFLSFPCSWFDLSDSELKQAVLDRIEEERIDIEYREAKSQETRLKVKEESERKMLAILKEKYPDQ